MFQFKWKKRTECFQCRVKRPFWFNKSTERLGFRGFVVNAFWPGKVDKLFRTYGGMAAYVLEKHNTPETENTYRNETNILNTLTQS